MNPLQRRVLALCIFALAFIFFYEARGMRLIMLGGESDISGGQSLLSHYWHQVGVGAFVLVLGVLLLAVLRRPGQKLSLTATECMAYALGIGILIGTAPAMAQAAGHCPVRWTLPGPHRSPCQTCLILLSRKSFGFKTFTGLRRE